MNLISSDQNQNNSNKTSDYNFIPLYKIRKMTNLRRFPALSKLRRGPSRHLISNQSQQLGSGEGPDPPDLGELFLTSSIFYCLKTKKLPQRLYDFYFCSISRKFAFTSALASVLASALVLQSRTHQRRVFHETRTKSSRTDDWQCL